MPAWVDLLPAWLRQLMQKIFRGESLTEDDLTRLPKWLYDQLLSIWSSVGSEAMRRAFLENVPELIQAVSPETYQEVLEIQRKEFRLAQVGSEIVALPPSGHRWFPELLHPVSRPSGAPGSLLGAQSGKSWQA